MDGRQQESWMSARRQGLEPDDTEWPPMVDTTVAHPARRYDYWLGGKDNFAADRESGDAIAAAFPTVRTAVIENRRFVRRAVAFLAGHAGIQQFLDIGTGIPTSPNVHEIAQAIAPASRVVYVDNDPIVLAHARALSPAPRRAPPPTSTLTCVTPARSSPIPGCWTPSTSPVR